MTVVLPGPLCLPAEGWLAVTRSNVWIRSLIVKGEEPQRAGVESCRQAAFPLGIFSWHLRDLALKIAISGSSASPVPHENSRPLWVLIICFLLRDVGNCSTRLSRQRLLQNLGWDCETGRRSRIQPPSRVVSKPAAQAGVARILGWEKGC